MSHESPQTEPRPPRRWKRKLSFALVLLIGVPWLWFFVVGRSELNRSIAETDALDPGWRLADIEAARDKIPDAENSALVVSAGVSLMSPNALVQIDSLDLPHLRAQPEWLLTTQEVTQIHAIVTANAAALVE